MLDVIMVMLMDALAVYVLLNPCVLRHVNHMWNMKRGITVEYENENCKGCFTYMREPGCAYGSLPECCGVHSYDCPCTKCIIKVMCAEACGPFMDYERRHKL